MVLATRLNDLGTGKLEAPKLRPEIIIIKNGHNYRDMTTPEVRQHIDWLKDSIRQEGVKDPITVSFADGKAYLEAGECRLTACKELRKEGWDGFIPCIGIKGDEASVMAKSLIDNSGLPPTLLELGVAVQRLSDYGWEMDRIAKCIPPSLCPDPAKALRVAKKALDLHQAPIEVKKAVKEGVDGVKISEGRAIAEAKKNPLTAATRLREAAGKAKAKGETILKREKGAGVATKAKQASQETTDKLLTAADELAEAALDDDLAISELHKKARAYQKLRGK